MVALQVYNPDCSLPNELTVAVIVLSIDPDNERVVVVNGLLTGADFDSSISTVNGISISGPLINIIAQFKVTADPSGRTGLDTLLDNNTEV